MELTLLQHNFTVCKIKDIKNIDFTREFVFLSKTDDELSLVCESDYTPSDTIVSESGWKALKISGILDFGMVGVIAKISNILAKESISLFVISTYNTDYILVKETNIYETVELLKNENYFIK